MNVIRGKKDVADRSLIYGPPGVGKSTWATGAPGTLAIDGEAGLSQIGCDRVELASGWDESLRLVRQALASDCKLLAIDTVDALETRAVAHVCASHKKKSLADFGYGDGFELLSSAWLELLGLLEQGRARGTEVILVAHVQQKNVNDPTIGAYEKYIPQLSKRCWNLTHRWCDNVFFADYERGLVNERAVLTGARQLHVVAASGFDAKNRYGVVGPLPLERAAWDEAKRPPEALGAIGVLVARYPELAEKVTTALKLSPANMVLEGLLEWEKDKEKSK
jgi:hypothetical protein